MDVSFFGEMAWKSALIAGAALALAYVLRSRAAADRALVLRLGVAMLILLPVIALALPALQVEAWTAPPAPTAATLPLDQAYVASPALSTPILADASAAPSIWDDPTPLVLLAYLGGVLMAGTRLLAGLLMLGRWTRGARAVDCPVWAAAFERVRRAAPERLRLMVSDSVPSPLSWGWRNPVILIDPDTLAQGHEAEAILAHEIAHVVRRDWPVLMATRIAAALFWFNPLVWLLEREIVQQAEEAADAEAARAVEPVAYARTLLGLAQIDGRLVPANSIAPSGSALARRVKAILDRRLRERPSGSAWTKIAAIACIAIAAPIAAMQLVEGAAAQEAPDAPDAPDALDAPDSLPPRAPPHAPAPLHGVPPLPPAPPELPDVAPIVDEALAEILPQIPQMVAEATAGIDPEAIEREVAQALRTARPHMERMTAAESGRVAAEVRRALAQARVQIAQVDRAEIRRAMAQARATARVTPQLVRASMAHGADGMRHGADGMEAGARRMEEQARRLQDRSYREREIARARARGETVTHEELIEAAEGMREGAEGMREGAREMRAAAERMHDGRD